MSNNKNNNDSMSPSMDDILQSIRGVINDNMSENKPEKNNKDTSKKLDNDILELTMVADDESGNEKLENDSGDQDNYVPFSENVQKDLEKQSTEKSDSELNINSHDVKPDSVSLNVNNSGSEESNLPSHQMDYKKESLVSQEVAAAASDTLRSLLNITNKVHSEESLKFRSGVTVEEIVVEAMKPYLTKWLDDNLNNVVKLVVEKEIKKLIPKDDE